ncbi:neuronal acetylcholine receptor subunit alpha-7-like isoform X2 [Portunus trituberculatus]|uniref:neuronal acetylcholine receptor subunit alpha-7-like isoform X2 n=1 Tax=Portunus trituberculatus TaxID=210409 RepID=UPI001E1CF050|nr:neuronal acetylcholine receptor subunit alpha-7-like isoform X2 [Portunus trituberculatus]
MHFTVRMVALVGVVMVMAVVVAIPQDTSIRSIAKENFPEMDNWIDRLYVDKIKGYNKNARPVLDHTHNTTVTMAMSLKNIDMDDEKQEFILNAWSIMYWKDELLEWNPMDYMNLKNIHFDDEDVWLPDIRLYNSATGYDAHPFGSVPVLVTYDGNAVWFPPTHIVVRCDMDLSEWPKDEHECLVRLGSWAHHGDQIDMQVQGGQHAGVMTDTLEENNRWKLLHVSANRTYTKLDGHNPYVEVDFVFRVQRQARTQATYVTQTTLAVVVVVLVSYVLPLQRLLTRLLMHLFSLALLIICFFALFAILPATGGPVPLVVRYYSGSIILTTLSLLATIFLTTRPCCCCWGSCCSSSSSKLARTLRTPYNHLDETLEEEVEEQRRPRAAQLNEAEGSTSRYIRLQDDAEQGGTKVDQITSHQFILIINYLLMALFTIAFVVDYVVLRNVML